MKTLDEVIFEAPYTPTPWEVDALFYLKEYRSDKAMWEADRKGLLDWIEQYKEAREKHQQAVIELKKNPPLTWDELKGMIGKPVWVVEEGYQTWEYWSLVYWMKDDELTLLNENGQTTYSKNEQGTVWQAYRKERS